MPDTGKSSAWSLQEILVDPAGLMEELKQYVGLTSDDVQVLRDLAPLLEPRLPEMADRFYEFILRNDRVKQIFEGGSYDVKRLQGTLMEWARGLTSGRYDADYARRRLVIGLRHLHIGIEMPYTFAAFNLVRSHLVNVLTSSDRPPAALARDLQAINRILDIDLCIVSVAYSAEQTAVTISEKDEERRGVEARLQGLLDSGNVLILTVDREGKVIYFNRTCEELTGWSAGDVIGRRLVDVLIPKDARHHLEEDLQSCFGCRPRQGRRLPPRPLRSRKGREYLIEWFPTCLCDRRGVPTEAILLGHDVTEQQRLLSQTMHQEKMAAVGLLAAGVAHEIGNPLASISSVAQTLRRKTSDPYVVEKLRLVNRHIDRITTIVRQMVDFARPPRYERRPCSINEIVTGTIEILRYDKRAQGVNIELSLAEDVPQVDGIEDQLTQVFLNLGLNALDALSGIELSKGDGACLRVASRLVRNEGDSIEVIFEDNGPGIDPNVVPRIFEPFFTTKDVGHGTGLGLAVSDRILAEHGGRLRFESNDPRGARFIAVIPIPADAPEEP